MALFKTNFISRFFSLIPLLILFYLAFSETDFNFEKLSFLSFNLIYILIFFSGIPIGRVELIKEKFHVKFFSDLSQLYLINVVTSEPMRDEQ